MEEAAIHAIERYDDQHIGEEVGEEVRNGTFEALKHGFGDKEEFGGEEPAQSAEARVRKT